jgi:hypothetical protein
MLQDYSESIFYGGSKPVGFCQSPDTVVSTTTVMLKSKQSAFSLRINPDPVENRFAPCHPGIDTSLFIMPNCQPYGDLPSNPKSLIPEGANGFW